MSLKVNALGFLIAPPFAAGILSPFADPVTVTIYENMKSRSTMFGSNATHSREYVLAGTSDQGDALRAIENDVAQCPLYYSEVDRNGFLWRFFRENAAFDPILNADPPTMWHCKVSYKLLNDSSQPRNAGESVTTFAIGDQSVTVKAGSTETAYPTGGTTPTQNNFINVQPGGEIQGVEISVPTFKFTRLVVMADSDVTQDYINALWSVALAPVNNAPFLGFDTHEVKFLGVSGTRKNKFGDWELNFEFAVSQNLTDAAPWAGLGAIHKNGWQYLWFTPGRQVQTVSGGKSLVQIYKYAYVNDVYQESDFSVLQVPPS